MTFYNDAGDKPSYDLSVLNVLVVDDNKHMLLLVSEILRALNVRSIQTATDGADALKVLRTFSPDLVFVDWCMSPLDGLELVEMIRKSPDSDCPYVPIIMLTGHTEYFRVIDAMNAGINEFLAKPVSAQSIYSRIVSVIQYPRKFIRCNSYVGPDRRRKSKDSCNYAGKLRRKDDASSKSIGSMPCENDQESAVLEEAFV